MLNWIRQYFCKHEFETTVKPVEKYFYDDWTFKLIDNLKEKYNAVTKFCKKCGKVVQYKDILK